MPSATSTRSHATGTIAPATPPTPAAAIAQMRRAGFADVTARADRLVHDFDVEGTVGFLTEFDEEDLVASLGPERRPRFEAGAPAAARRPRHGRSWRSTTATVTVRGVRR